MEKRRIAFGLMAILAVIVVALVALQVYGVPQTIDTTNGEATIHFTADRTWRLLADTCFTVSWQVEQTNALYLNGDGKIGYGEETLCDTNAARLTLDLRDGTTHDYVLAATPFFATMLGWLTLFTITLLVYRIYYLLNWMPAPNTILQSIRQSLQGIQRDTANFFRTEERSHILLLVAILIAGTILRLIYLDGAMRYDEAGSLSDYVLVDNVLDSLSNYDRPNNHLLNTLLMYGSMKIFGTIDEWALRLPHFIAGIFTILLTYIAARQQADKNAALLAAGLVAVSSAMITYSVMARGYMLQIAFMMGLVIVSYHLTKKSSSAAWIGFTLCTALGFYAVLIKLYSFVGIALWLLWLFIQHDKSRVREWFIGMFWAGWFTLLLYMPVLTRFGLGAITSNSYTSPLSWTDFFNQLPGTLENIAEFWLGGMSIIWALVLLVGLVLGVIFRGQYIAPIRNMLFFVLGSTLLIVTLQHPALYAAPHIFLYLVPLLVIPMAAGLVWLFQKIRMVEVGILLLLGVLAVSTVVSRAPFLTYEGGIYHDAEAVVAYLAAQENPNFRLALSPNYDEQLKYYLRRYNIPLERMSRDYEAVDSIYFIVRDTFDTLAHVSGDLIGERGAPFSAPQKVAEFEFSDLYRMDRQ
jgi:4-amino-4-deoxy-L-arabinose transferase-like glycosyltransferase